MSLISTSRVLMSISHDLQRTLPSALQQTVMKAIKGCLDDIVPQVEMSPQKVEIHKNIICDGCGSVCKIHEFNRSPVPCAIYVNIHPLHRFVMLNDHGIHGVIPARWKRSTHWKALQMYHLQRLWPVRNLPQQAPWYPPWTQLLSNACAIQPWAFCGLRWMWEEEDSTRRSLQVHGMSRLRLVCFVFWWLQPHPPTSCYMGTPGRKDLHCICSTSWARTRNRIEWGQGFSETAHSWIFKMIPLGSE